ncbi:oligosaccharide flippase family protein [Exiguobacterium sp. NPDC077395]|uniref:oligosaccharide flippase family protein n=1 Tax=Exiguobacterium sp. NPDC077395 TaxID=3390563 RepID=UPI003CFF87B2
MLKHTLNYFLGKGLPGIINFIAIAVYTRILSPNEYGIYAIVLTTVTLINTMFFSWLRLGVLRYTNKYNKNKKAFLSSIFFIFVILLVIFIILAVVVYFLIPFKSSYIIIWIFAAILLILQSTFDLFTEYLRAELLSKRFGVITGIKTISSFIFSILFIHSGMDGEGIILGISFGIIFSLLLIFPIKDATFKFSNVDWNIVKEVIKYSLPFIVMLSMEAIMFSSDRFLISWYHGTAETGVYAVSYDLSKQILMMLMLIINLASYPLVVKALEEKGIEACKKQMKINTTYLLLISLPAVAALIVLRGPITDNLLGEEFRNNAAQIFGLISIAIFMQGFKLFYFDLAFQLGENTKKQNIPVVIAVIVNILLNILFIPKYSVIGAAYATIIAYFCSIVLSAYIGRKVFRLGFPFIEAGKILVATAIMLLVLRNISIPVDGILELFFKIVIGMSIYVISILCLRVVSFKNM